MYFKGRSYEQVRNDSFKEGAVELTQWAAGRPARTQRLRREDAHDDASFIAISGVFSSLVWVCLPMLQIDVALPDAFLKAHTQLGAGA